MAEVVQVAGRWCDAKAHRTLRGLAVGPALAALAFGDFDGDGRTDVFVSVCP